MPNSNHTVTQINALIGNMIEAGLADRQHGAFRRGSDASMEVTFHGATSVSIALKDRYYTDIYQHLTEAGAYNARMLDGALVQMMYVFSNEILQSHRLAFFPSPDLEEFQNNPDIYLEEEVYADVVAKNIVSFPIRFDYEISDGSQQGPPHPKCHLTLGQYENCRIPVTAPMTPIRFIDFILRNFYHTGFSRYAEMLPSFPGSFTQSIRAFERRLVHVTVPE